MSTPSRARAHTTPAGRPRALTRYAGPAAVVLSAAALTATIVLDSGLPAGFSRSLGLSPGWPDAFAGLALSLAGATVLARSGHRLGWLLVGFGVWWSVDSVCSSWLAEAARHTPVLAGASTAFWVYQRLGSGLLLLLPLLLLLYPDGRLPRGGWRVAVLVSLASTALLPVSVLLAPSDVAQRATSDGRLPAPFRGLHLDPTSVPLPDGVWLAVLHTAYLATPLSLVVPFALVVTRYRGAEGLRRTRMRWLLWAGLVDVLLMLTFAVLPDVVSSLGLTLSVAATAAAVTVGLVRPDLVDIDRLLGSTLVYGALVVASYLLDLLVLGTAGHALGSRLTDSQGLVVAVFVVSLVYAPLRHRLWALVRRTTRGEREDPYRVVSRLAERMETTDTPVEQLQEVARAVAQAFRTPYVGVEIWQATGGRLLVEHGSPTGETDALPIGYRGEQVGRLLLPRSPRRHLRAADERLLADVVRQAAAASRAQQLADELQASRERIVTAVEDERRRLRNELHDGLGPTLAAVASRIDTARITGRRSPEEADALLRAAREDITGLLGEVRRLVHGLRPPALDDVGLAGAVRQLAERTSGPALDVRLDVPDRPGGLPAAVEVAAYRIVAEALANVLRHAGAGTAWVRLATTGTELMVEVADDGRGIEPDAPAGVGLVSLRERAGELGGRCEVEARPGGGTVVRAVLPCGGPAGADVVREGGVHA